jgi:hypothetical protein
MAHTNITERRAYVKSIMELGEITRMQIREVAVKFSCTYSTICADIAMINKKGEYTICPGKSTKNIVLKRDNHTCQYCGAVDKKLLVDHVIPT